MGLLSHFQTCFSVRTNFILRISSVYALSFNVLCVINLCSLIIKLGYMVVIVQYCLPYQNLIIKTTTTLFNPSGSLN